MPFFGLYILSFKNVYNFLKTHFSFFGKIKKWKPKIILVDAKTFAVTPQETEEAKRKAKGKRPTDGAVWEMCHLPEVRGALRSVSRIH